MKPQKLAQLANDLDTAAELVEAIECPEVGRERGWDLDGWRYRLSPWGVCFIHRDLNRGIRSEITVRLSPPLPLRAVTASRYTREPNLFPAAGQAYAHALEA